MVSPSELADESDWHRTKAEIVENDKGFAGSAFCLTCGWRGATRLTTRHHPRYVERKDAIEEQVCRAAERHQHAMFQIEFDAMEDDEIEEEL